EDVAAARNYLGPYYEELWALRESDPEFFPHPDRTGFKVVTGDELYYLRREFESSGLRGHHAHPLGHGGPAVPGEGGLAYTGERIVRKSEAPNLDWSWYPNKAAKKMVWHAPNKESGILLPGLNPRHAAATKYWSKVTKWRRSSGTK